MEDVSTNIFTEIPWVALDAPVKSAVGMRSPTQYAQVVKQFCVMENPRYRPRDGKTYCNIFVWDVTRAMGCELPHWITDDGRIALANTVGAKRLDCNALNRWINEYGHLAGWNEVSQKEAMLSAQSGQPSIAIWENHVGNGHIAILIPPSTTSMLRFAQAGRMRFDCGSKKEAFGAREPRYWTHT